MRKLALLGLLLATPAAATDVTTKASSSTSCTTTSCSGWYAGGDIEGAGPVASGAADLTNGAGLGLHGGYQIWNGSFFAAGEVAGKGYFGASTFTAASGQGSIDPGKWSVDYKAKFGYGLQSLFSVGNVTTPSQGLFANLNANLITPYIEAGGRTRQFGTGFLVGAGIEYTLGNHWTLDMEYIHVNYNYTPSGASVTLGSENAVIVGVSYMF